MSNVNPIKNVTVNGRIYEHVRTIPNLGGSDEYLMRDVTPRALNVGSMHTFKRWASRPDFYYVDSNGCGNKDVVQMVDGQFVDRTADFDRAEVVRSGWVGSLTTTYVLDGVEI